jgi:hypothetical protein
MGARSDVRAWSAPRWRGSTLLLCTLAALAVLPASPVKALTLNPGPAQPELTATVTRELLPLGEQILADYGRAPHASRQKKNVGGSKLFVTQPATAFLVEYRARSAITHARSEYILDAEYKRTATGVDTSPAGLLAVQIHVPTKLIAPPIAKNRGFILDTYSFSCARSSQTAQLTASEDHWQCAVGYYAGPAGRLLSAARYYQRASGTTGPSCSAAEGCIGTPPLSPAFFSAALAQAQRMLSAAQHHRTITRQQNLAAVFPDSRR